MSSSLPFLSSHFLKASGASSREYRAYTKINLENQRTLLRTMCPQARLLPIQERGILLQQLYGEVHVCVEHREQTVCRENTT
jgi:hypothetical protein